MRITVMLMETVINSEGVYITIIYLPYVILFCQNILQPSFRCSCFKGYTGADCSLRLCPFDSAWVDVPIAQDVAHQPAECSNMGIYAVLHSSRFFSSSYY